MLTREENQLLTRVDAESPGGQLLRRYWQPVAIATELTDEKPIMKVRVLGEDLVVYRDKKGSYGLVGEHCPHRMASLAYGRVDEEGIRCPYHGWKFSAAGRCLEQPAEPKGSNYKNEIKHTAYPVQRLGGLLFAYLGPLPSPALPRWDVLAWENGRRWIQKQSLLNCNWLQAMENSVDPSHLYWLHGASAHLGKLGEYDEKHEFITFEFGIMKRRTTGVSAGAQSEVDQHPLLFPNILRHVLKTKNQKEGKVRHNLQFRLPVDDTHTQVFVCFFEPSETERTSPDAEVPFEHLAVRNEEGKYRLDQVLVQDAMAWETQGAVMDRSREHLGTGDKGVVILRKLLREQIDIMRRGGTPLGCIPKDQERPIIELDVINERIGVGSHKRDVA
jgi:5,5'-dehydrodivanillate O-demethylase